MERRRPTWALAMVVAALLIGGAAGWAGRQVLRPAAPPEEPLTYALVDVVEGDVGSALPVTTAAVWSTSPLGINEAAGTVTAIEAEPGAEISAGDVLYEVDEQPVTVALGDIPAYRIMSVGARGADVRQLQELLGDLGFLEGEPDGVFGASTAAAVRAWQHEIGVEVTGAVSLGSVMFLPDLPARVRLSEETERGAHVSGGERVLEVYPSAPVFQAALTPGQADVVSPGMSVSVEGPSGTWDAVIERIEQTDDGSVLARLTGADATPVCGDDCADIPVDGGANFPTQIELVPSVVGPTVPVGALVTAADGEVQVVLEDGERVDVIMTAQGGGYAVIEGVDIGTSVRVPGE